MRHWLEGVTWVLGALYYLEIKGEVMGVLWYLPRGAFRGSREEGGVAEPS